MKKGIFSLLALAALTVGFTHYETLCEGLVPENDMYIPADMEGLNGGISEAEFNAVIDQVESYYSPIVSSMGGTLSVNRLWTNGTVNASAQRRFTTWIVNMYGGLARHPDVTVDGFALVVCHELGHHMGGAPKYSGFMNKWASNEGQSDYWATLKCLRRVWQNDDNTRILRTLDTDSYAMSQCRSQFNTQEEIAICARSAMAGKSLASLFRTLRKQTTQIKFDTPDGTAVQKTSDAHPKPQCRMDTYFQGALCDLDFEDDVDQKSANVATCNRQAGDDTGIRPLCWYKP